MTGPRLTGPRLPAARRRKLERVLFVSSAFAFDPTLGGVRSFRLLAQTLAARGVKVEYVCGGQVGFAYGRDRSASEPGDLRQLARQSRLRVRSSRAAGAFEFRHAGVRFHAVHVRHRFEPLARASDASMQRLLRAVHEALARFEPDLVMTVCFSGQDTLVHKLALSQGYPVGHVVSTVDIVETEAIEFCTGLMVLSNYTIREFRKVLPLAGKAVSVIYPLIEIAEQPASDGGFVTFVNPIEDKGLALFLALVRQFATELPEQKFLVVESRGTAEQVRRATGVDLRSLPNVVVHPCTQDMSSVYRQTKVLLVPSLWREAYGMVVTEAQMHGIPVLASNRGGLPEALYGASRPLPPLAPGDAAPRRRRVTAAWAAELRKLLVDGAHRRAQIRAARRAAAQYRKDQSPRNVHAKFRAFYEDLVRRRLSPEHEAHLAEFRAELGL